MPAGGYRGKSPPLSPPTGEEMKKIGANCLAWIYFADDVEDNKFRLVLKRRSLSMGEGDRRVRPFKTLL